MYQSLKAICIAVIMAAVFVSLIAWTDDRPSTATWLLRALSALSGILAIGIFLFLKWKLDLAPDVLALQVGRYLEQNGFCFHLEPRAVDGKCVFLLLFQNRYERPCTASVAIRPVTFSGVPETL